MTETNHVGWLNAKLLPMADLFPALTLPNMARNNNDAVQLSALHELHAADEMRAEADEVSEKHLEAVRVATGLSSRIAELKELIAEGTRALRAGEPVTPEAGVAGFLIPELEGELSAANFEADRIGRELEALRSKAELCTSNASRTIDAECRARRVQRINMLLSIAMDEATALAVSDSQCGAYGTRITLDPRLQRVAANGCAVEILRPNRGTAL